MIIIITKKGKIKRIDEKLIRIKGRTSRGIVGISLEREDEVAGIVSIPN